MIGQDKNNSKNNPNKTHDYIFYRFYFYKGFIVFIVGIVSFEYFIAKSAFQSIMCSRRLRIIKNNGNKKRS